MAYDSAKRYLFDWKGSRRMKELYIQVNHLSKTIDRRMVLEDVCLAIPKESITGFVGKNGSGKTMLLRAIGGLIKPTQGEVIVCGQVLGKDIPYPPSMGIMIENIGLWNHLTGLECLKLLAEIKQIIKIEEIRAAITRVGLDPDDKRKFGKYSLGMKQRLIIAQALMERPELLILDEPTNALDTDGVALVRNILLEEKQRGATILIASHVTEDVAALCEHVYYMYEGRLRDRP
jgi:ABC-2 type transport system ATP-binding protein